METKKGNETSAV